MVQMAKDEATVLLLAAGLLAKLDQRLCDGGVRYLSDIAHVSELRSRIEEGSVQEGDVNVELVDEPFLDGGAAYRL